MITELHRRGIRPGTGLAIAGFEGSWLCETTPPALTSVELSFTDAIRSAVADVIHLIEGRAPVLVAVSKLNQCTNLFNH